MTTFRGYAAHQAGAEMTPIEYEAPPLAHNRVRLKVDYCGVCHTDLSMLKNDWGITKYPFVGGHEIVGTISETGPGVTHFEVGQAVGLGWHAGYCLTCPSCVGGDHNLCSALEGTILGRHGGFADYVHADATAVRPLPAGIDSERAGPLLCAGITVFNPLVQFDIRPTDRVGVIGIGGLGHLALQFYRAWGCDVAAFTSPGKMDDARAMGATSVINSRDPQQIAAAARSFDLILTTANVKLDWNAYLSTLKPKGRLHIVGGVTEPLDIATFPMLSGQLQVSASSVGGPAVIDQMFAFAVRHDIRPVIETFPMNQINEAMAHLESGQARYRIVLKA